MLINLSPEIFEGSEQDFISLNFLIQLLTYRHRYDFFVDISQLEDNTFYKKLDDTNREIIEIYYNRYITSSQKYDFEVCRGTDAEYKYSVEDAIKWLNQPFLLILENSDNDGYFIDALIRCFSRRSKKISRLKSETWFKFAMGGGAESIIHVIEAEKKNYGGKSKFLRCFVLIDSDKEYPEMPSKKMALLNYLEGEKIQYFVLEKREIENYMPDDILKSFNDTYLDIYLNMSEIQKDYFDIEKGFAQKPLKSFSEPVQNLYSNIDSKSFSTLRNGIPSLIVGKKFKSEFPKLFEKASKEGLLARTKHQSNPNELENILDKITSLL